MQKMFPEQIQKYLWFKIVEYICVFLEYGVTLKLQMDGQSN